jgi:hypothetical protein
MADTAKTLSNIRVSASNLALQQGSLTLLTGSTVTAKGDVRVAALGELIVDGGTLNLTGNLEVDGIFRRASGTFDLPGGAINNRGMVYLPSGKFEVTGGGTGTGSYQLGNGTELTFRSGSYQVGSITGPGSVLIDAATATVSGSFAPASATINSGGTLNVNGSANPGSISINGGALGGTGAVTTALLNLSAGTCGGSGDFSAQQISWSGGSFSGNLRNLSLTHSGGDFDLPGALTVTDQLTLAAPNGMLRVGNSVQGKMVALSGSTVLIAAPVTATQNLSVTSPGALQVVGDNGTAKLLASGTLTIGANSVLVNGGSHGASIDPTSLVLTTPGDLVLQGGTAPAVIAGNTVSISAANVLLTGGAGGYAAIQALNGDLSVVTPLTGRVMLTPGSGLNADAALVAPAGNLVRVVTGQCVGCDTLAAYPLSNQLTENGAFAGTVQIVLLNPSEILSFSNSITQATVVAGTAVNSPNLTEPLGNSSGDDKTRKKRSLPACPVR